jgi:CDP-diacylglycerol--serine O-phosphatidyltransferase
MKLFTIPNLFTLGNLLCGCLAIVFALDGDLKWSAYLVGIAAVLDFFDGFVARLLNSSSPIGKELDSLADCVTFGVVPGIVLMQLMNADLRSNFYSNVITSSLFEHGGNNIPPTIFPMALIGLVVSLFSALRLAKFNIDTRQSESFIGVPTPAIGMLVAALSLMIDVNPALLGNKQLLFESYSLTIFDTAFNYVLTADNWFSNYWFLAGFSVVASFLLISELPLFALKFKKFGWKGNEVRYSFLVGCAVMIAFLGYAGIALSIVAYIVLSFVLWFMNRGKESTNTAQ